MDHAPEIRDSLRAQALSLRAEIPEVFSAYARLSQAATAEGELPALTKEFAALAIALVKECDGCIVAHLRSLIRMGATRRQVAELTGVAIAMDGGPGTVWGPRALAAYDELVEEAASGSPKR
jgi:AhpD family alkylhydroperoxidase